jgi:hypothetical protein
MKIKNMINAPKTHMNVGAEAVPDIIPLVALAIMEKTMATAIPMDTIGKITFIKLA